MLDTVPLRRVAAGELDVAYYDLGPAGAEPVVMLHGFPYDVHSYREVAPLLVEAGFRVVVPYLRGHGPTRFRDDATPRSGQQAALGADLVRAARAFDNPDYVDVVVHSYRHRLGLATGAPAFEADEAALAQLPPIAVPTITLDGTADGNFPATDGAHDSARFTAWREHRQVPHAGHHLSAEAPRAFADAILDVAEPPGDGAGTP